MQTHGGNAWLIQNHELKYLKDTYICKRTESKILINLINALLIKVQGDQLNMFSGQRTARVLENIPPTATDCYCVCMCKYL